MLFAINSLHHIAQLAEPFQAAQNRAEPSYLQPSGPEQWCPALSGGHTSHQVTSLTAQLLRQQISQQANNCSGPINHPHLVRKIELDRPFNAHELTVTQLTTTNRVQEFRVYSCGCNKKRCMMTTDQEGLDISGRQS